MWRTLSRIVIAISTRYVLAGEAMAAHADRVERENREKQDRKWHSLRSFFYPRDGYQWVDEWIIFPLIALRKRLAR